MDWYRDDEILIFSNMRYKRYVLDLKNDEKVYLTEYPIPNNYHITITYMLLENKTAGEVLLYQADNFEIAKEWVEDNFHRLRKLAKAHE